LRIEVNEKYTTAKFCQGSAKVDCGCRLSDTTFLVEDRDYSSVSVLSDRCGNWKLCDLSASEAGGGDHIIIFCRYSAQSRNLFLPEADSTRGERVTASKA
jgi:hypothetical protein